jgi:hypothetical protein
LLTLRHNFAGAPGAGTFEDGEGQTVIWLAKSA